MFVKTTKGIYELNENRRVIVNEDLNDLYENNGGLYLNDDDMPFSRNTKWLGEIVAQSDNLGDLIEFQYQVDEDNVVYNIKSTRGVDDKDRKLLIADTNDRIIGLIRIGDDLVKVAEWGNEKGEWKLYER